MAGGGMGKENPTLRDLARAAGVSVASVSMALRNDPRIKAETRAKIHAVAEELGYRPDPHISDLMGYLRNGRTRGFRETIAFVSKMAWNVFQENLIFHEVYVGAAQRAQSLGYSVEFHTVSGSMTESRLGSILRNRGIRGIIVLPQLDPEGKSRGYESFPWEDFASVAIGFSCPTPDTHRVMPDQIQALHVALKASLKLGYKRPGLVIERWKDDRVRNHWTASFLSFQERNFAPRDRIPISVNPGQLVSWYSRWKPDFLIGSDIESTVSLLRAAGFRSPEDFGYATLNKQVEGRWAFHSGVWEPFIQVGSAAADLLAGCLNRNEIGLPAYPQIVLLPVVWMDGESAPARISNEAETADRHEREKSGEVESRRLRQG
jgi:LacI family transcriptional regulator